MSTNTPRDEAVQFAKDYLAMRITLANGEDVLKLCRALVQSEKLPTDLSSTSLDRALEAARGRMLDTRTPWHEDDYAIVRDMLAAAKVTDIEPFRDELLGLLERRGNGSLDDKVFSVKVEGVLKAIRGPSA
jgi:hypothetical protein